MLNNKQNDNKKMLFENFFAQIRCLGISLLRNVFLKYTVDPFPSDIPNMSKPFHYFTKSKY